MNTGQRGAQSELIVSADLLDRGFEVFRSVAQACSCDLIAMKGRKLIRIEVRTGKMSQTAGKVKFQHGLKDSGRYDSFAVVTTGEVTYFAGPCDKVREISCPSESVNADLRGFVHAWRHNNTLTSTEAPRASRPPLTIKRPI